MQNARVSQLGDPLLVGVQGLSVVQDRGLPAGLHLPGGAPCPGSPGKYRSPVQPGTYARWGGPGR
jgi:hypothetical protein